MLQSKSKIRVDYPHHYALFKKKMLWILKFAEIKVVRIGLIQRKKRLPGITSRQPHVLTFKKSNTFENVSTLP